MPVEAAVQEDKLQMVLEVVRLVAEETAELPILLQTQWEVEAERAEDVEVPRDLNCISAGWTLCQLSGKRAIVNKASLTVRAFDEAHRNPATTDYPVSTDMKIPRRESEMQIKSR